jgi:glycosyltransferase involved in cell wall biosynthesis
MIVSPTHDARSCVRATVIMINRNGGKFLRDALRSLRLDLETTWRAEPCFELLVIDNNSTDGSRKIIEAGLAGAAFPWRLALEEKAGVNAARNAALRQARGELLLFTDSDLRFEPGWLDAYLRAATEHPHAEVFAGRVKVGLIEGKVPSWLDVTGPFRRTAIVVQMDLGEDIKLVPFTSECGPVGPNMAFRRTLFENYGEFDERFGLRPGSLVPGAEAEFFDRLSRAGESFVYVPGALVYHPVKREQLATSYFLKRLYGTGRVAARLHHLRGLRCHRIAGAPRFMLRVLAGALTKYFISCLNGGPRKRFYYRGELSVILGYFHEDVLLQRR